MIHSLIMLQVHMKQNQQLTLARNVQQIPTKHPNISDDWNSLKKEARSSET